MRPDGNGKGDKPRPLGVPLEKFDNNWDAIFKKKKFGEEAAVAWSDVKFKENENESSTGHRDEQQSQQDMVSGN